MPLGGTQDRPDSLTLEGFTHVGEGRLCDLLRGAEDLSENGQPRE